MSGLRSNAASNVLGGSKRRKTQTVNLGKKGKFSVRKGALHRALNIPEGQTIPRARLKQALNSKNPSVRRMAASARGFAAMHHGK